jgi:uncharacterized protein YacL
MAKLFSNDKLRFFTKVTAAHVITYWLVAFIAMPLTINYIDYAVELMGLRPIDEINMGAVMIGQIIRGLLLGLVIWWIKDSIFGKKLAWLKLWGIRVRLGIFNTYGLAHGSIQGIIYLAPIEDIPARLNFGIVELFAQVLLFSVAVTFQRKKKHELV